VLIWISTSENGPPLLAGAPPETKNESKVAKAIAEAYLSNRESFTFFTCRFRLRSGQARTVDKALAGSLFDTTSATGVWIVHGPNVRFEIVCDPISVQAAFRKSAAASVVGVPLPMKKFLDNGSIQLLYSPIGNAAVLHRPADRRATVELSPFDMGVMGRDEEFSPARVIQDSLRKGAFCEIESEKPTAGGRVIVSVGPSRNRIDEKYFFDPKTGFILREAWMSRPDGTGLLHKVFITDVRECSPNRWFPTRSVYVSKPDAQGPHKVREITVVALDSDHPPKDADFLIELPGGTHLNDGVQPASQLTLATQERVRLKDLENLAARCEARSQSVSAEAADLERRRLTGSQAFLWIILVNVLILGAGGAVIAAIRHRKKRARQDPT
jgi:hypothetical protein